ncbi:hypothetical protein M9Y10_041638 [Tritrichomonas musculus]|uniref:Glycoprotein n=1 Tax=Tritrichomonas musculus TaxID=1915356 RepID=A0ABR2K4W9_9EUKA
MNLLYNVSIFSLASSLFSDSPLLCNYFSSSHRKISIQNSYFQNYIKPIYYSFESKTKFKISSCNIHNFLDQAIHADRNIEIDNQQIFSQISSIKTPFEPIYVIKCNFMSIYSRFCSGGAILSFSSLTVIDCLFNGCSTIRAGGAIACYSKLNMSNVNIQRCQALCSSSIYLDSYHKVEAIFNSVSTTKCNSKMSNGAITVRSPTNFRFTYSNLSYCENEGFYCGIWIDKSNVSVHFSFFCHNISPDINGGITSIFTRRLVVDYTMFIDLKLKAPNKYGAVSIYIDTNKDRNSTISNCVFNYPDTYSASIHVRTGFSVTISTCCFFCPENSERKGGLSNFQNDNVFGTNCELIKNKQKKQMVDAFLYKLNKNNEQNIFPKDKFHLLYNLLPLLFAIIFSILFIIL